MYIYRWSVTKIDGFPLVNGLENVINMVTWELEVRDSEDHSIHYIRETTQLAQPDPGTFTEHLELSSTDVLQFVWDIIGKDATEARAKAELDALRAPKTVELSALGMPWMQSCCADGKNIDQVGSTSTSV